MTTATTHNTIHEGRNVKRFREMLNMTQDALAANLGDDWTQKKVSLLEGKDKIEPEVLEQVSKALGVPPDAIKNFNEEAAVNIISNTFAGESVAYAQYYKCTFNPFEKWVDAMEKNEELYKQLLQSEREKIEILEKVLNEKRNSK